MLYEGLKWFHGPSHERSFPCKITLSVCDTELNLQVSTRDARLYKDIQLEDPVNLAIGYETNVDMGTTLPSRFNPLVSQSWPSGFETDRMLFDCDIVAVSVWSFREVTSLHDFGCVAHLVLATGVEGGEKRGGGMLKSTKTFLVLHSHDSYNQGVFLWGTQFTERSSISVTFIVRM